MLIVLLAPSHLQAIHIIIILEGSGDEARLCENNYTVISMHILLWHKTHLEHCPWTIIPPSHPGTVLASSKNALPEEPSSLLTHPDITLFRNTSGQ